MKDRQAGPSARPPASRLGRVARAVRPSARAPARPPATGHSPPDPEPAAAGGGLPAVPPCLASVEAVIFDLDGVVTDTAAVHAAAWKSMFDDYLRRRSERWGESFQPFGDEDYARHVDGRARDDGVRTFLGSRRIRLPDGDRDDPPDRETVHGLGNRKNDAFLERLRSDGARAYPTTVGLVRALREQGIRVAVISASRNLDAVLEAAGTSDLFAVRVSGIDAERLELPGKPDPAIFLEAARRLGVGPAAAAVVEDALPGVEAGRRGGFGLVIGVDRSGHADELLEAGADIVVGDLGDLGGLDAEARAGSTASHPRTTTPDQGTTVARPATIPPGTRPSVAGESLVEELPSALAVPDELTRLVGGRRVAVFLDYDGTLTPIVDDPAEARLDAVARRRVADVAKKIPVAIISGRDLPDVMRMVGIDGLWYAGSHGFDIVGPRGQRHREAPQAIGPLDLAEHALRRAIADVPGAWVERKAFALAVHVRRTPEDRIGDAERAVARVEADHGDLRMTGGKRVFELRPDVDWDKGRAVLRLLAIEGLDRADVAPVFVGDDLTDEDAFRALRDRGVGIIVRGEGDRRRTAARLSLAEPSEVPELLERLVDVGRATS